MLKLGAVLAGVPRPYRFLAAAPHPRGLRAGSALGSARASRAALTVPSRALATAPSRPSEGLRRLRGTNPLVEWDIREIPGGGPEWDRLARATIASGEPIDLVMINGQQFRRGCAMACWPTSAPIRGSRRAEPGAGAIPPPRPGRGDNAGISAGGHAGCPHDWHLLQQGDPRPSRARVPQTFADLRAAVQPLSKIGVAPLVHCSGDVFFNQILLTWLLPMVAERTGDPVQFVGKTVRGDIRYDGPEWIGGLPAIADLRTSGVLLDGSGATDYATMQRLLLEGKAAMTYNGSWLLDTAAGGTPTVPIDLHVAPPPPIEGASSSPDPCAGRASPSRPRRQRGRDNAYAFMEFASRPDVDRSVVAGLQVFSPIAGFERRDREHGRQGVPSDVQGRDHVPRLALGAGGQGRDRQPGPGDRERHDRPCFRRAAVRPSPRNCGPSGRSYYH